MTKAALTSRTNQFGDQIIRGIANYGRGILLSSLTLLFWVICLVIGLFTVGIVSDCSSMGGVGMVLMRSTGKPGAKPCRVFKTGFCIGSMGFVIGTGSLLEEGRTLPKAQPLTT